MFRIIRTFILIFLSHLLHCGNSTPKEDYTSNWGGNNYYTYIVLKENTNPKTLESKFPAFLDKSLPPYNGVAGSKSTKLHLQKITDIHLNSHLMGEAGVNGSMKYVYIFGGIAFFILLIACINYMNLTTALALSRLKEVGIRKVIGAERRQLFLSVLYRIGPSHSHRFDPVFGHSLFSSPRIRKIQ